MRKQADSKLKTLLEQIEEEALDSSSNLADVLRTCIAFGSRSGSETLRGWATHELKGYTGDVSLPDYRIIPAALAVDVRTAMQMVTGYQISTYDLPEPAKSTIKEEVRLSSPIAEIAEAIAGSRQNEDTICFGLPGGALLVKLMNAERRNRGQFDQVIDRVYYKCSVTSLVGVMDTVRTNLVELVAEMRSACSESSGTPSKDAADRAVQIVIYGGQPNVHVASHNTITGSQNVSLGSEEVQQSIVSLLPAVGDLEGLLDWLEVHGIPPVAIDELEKAIEADAAVGSAASTGPGDKVKTWIANATLKGTTAIGTGVSVELLVDAIKHFFGT